MAGLVQIARKTNRFARENIFSNVSGKCSFGICSRTSVHLFISLRQKARLVGSHIEVQQGRRVQASLYQVPRGVSI